MTEYPTIDSAIETAGKFGDELVELVKNNKGATAKNAAVYVLTGWLGPGFWISGAVGVAVYQGARAYRRRYKENKEYRRLERGRY